MQDNDSEVAKPIVGDLVQIRGDEYGICGTGIVLEYTDAGLCKVFWFDVMFAEWEQPEVIEVWDGTFATIDPKLLEYLDF